MSRVVKKTGADGKLTSRRHREEIGMVLARGKGRNVELARDNPSCVHSNERQPSVRSVPLVQLDSVTAQYILAKGLPGCVWSNSHSGDTVCPKTLRHLARILRIHSVRREDEVAERSAQNPTGVAQVASV